MNVIVGGYCTIDDYGVEYGINHESIHERIRSGLLLGYESDGVMYIRIETREEVEYRLNGVKSWSIFFFLISLVVALLIFPSVVLGEDVVYGRNVVKLGDYVYPCNDVVSIGPNKDTLRIECVTNVGMNVVYEMDRTSSKVEVTELKK